MTKCFSCMKTERFSENKEVKRDVKSDTIKTKALLTIS